MLPKEPTSSKYTCHMSFMWKDHGGTASSIHETAAAVDNSTCCDDRNKALSNRSQCKAADIVTTLELHATKVQLMQSAGIKGIGITRRVVTMHDRSSHDHKRIVGCLLDHFKPL